jgi:hypothetical protein
MIEQLITDGDGNVLEEGAPARLRVEGCVGSLAASLAALPIPRLTYGLWVVSVPGSRRVHVVATVDEVVRMIDPIGEVTEPRWVAVRTACGRSGPFGSPWPDEHRQVCRRCLAPVGGWDGFEAGDDRRPA